jgi:hypothetical protein
MKAIALIPLVVAGCVGIVASLLKLAGVKLNLLDPALAAAVAAAAATVAMLPILRTRQTDPVGIIQFALIGTVLHILCTFVLGAVLLFSHVENLHGPFVYWLLGAYWVSLAVLVWQLRLAILSLTNNSPQLSQGAKLK